MKRRAAIAVALAVVLLGVFITLVGWDDVFSAIEQASLSVYALAFVGTMICFSFRTAVWSRVLAVVDEPRPYWLIFSVFLTASFLKYVTPYGQVTSGVGVAAIVSRYTDAAYEESLAAILSADFLNYVPYYTFGTIGIAYVLLVESPSLDVRAHILPLVSLIVAIVLLVVFLWARRSFVSAGILRVALLLRRLVARVSDSKAKWLNRENVERRLEGFYTTLDLVSRNRRSMMIALVYAHAGWLGLALSLYISALALGAQLSFGIAMVVVAVSKVGFLLPTPGGLGGVEATIAGALFLLAPVSVAVATAIAILYRFATYWATVFVGGTTSMALTVKDPLPPE